MPDVEPVKSAISTTSTGHSGWAMIWICGSASLYASSSFAVNRSWTSQWPFQVRISPWSGGDVLREIFVGMQSTVSTPKLSTTSTALAEVQQMSLSAFTSAEVFT